MGKRGQTLLWSIYVARKGLQLVARKKRLGVFFSIVSVLMMMMVVVHHHRSEGAQPYKIYNLCVINYFGHQ